MMTRRNIVRSLLFNSCLLGSSVFAASTDVVALENATQSAGANIEGNNTTEVKTLYHFAIRGDVSAQLALARYYETHRQPEQGGLWYKRAALNGNAEAQFQYGLMCIDEEIECKDSDEGLFWIEQAAAQGHHQARVVADSILNEEFYLGC